MQNGCCQNPQQLPLDSSLILAFCCFFRRHFDGGDGNGDVRGLHLETGDLNQNRKRKLRSNPEVPRLHHETVATRQCSCHVCYSRTTSKSEAAVMMNLIYKQNFRKCLENIYFLYSNFKNLVNLSRVKVKAQIFCEGHKI